ncbi:MAG TPA: sulfotransferase [Nocardioides sp.]|nr:sulfotransferase [Nocardioides sp.]
MRRTPRTAEEIAALDATYVPFVPVTEWAERTCDDDRWQRHSDALRAARQDAGPDTWSDLRERFLRAAALDSSALSGLVRPAPVVTAVVLHESLNEEAWLAHAESTDLVIECHRRALVVAADAAEDGRAIDENLIALLQDMVVESQQTYTVTVEDGRKVEVDLPRRQYKPVSNYLRRPDFDLVAFAPAARVAAEMQRFVAELASEEFAALHPVLRSTYLHAVLTHIHPFADGNGRLARTLASIPLLHETGLPQLLLADQWPAYAQALKADDDGEPWPMIELFLSAQVDSMDLATTLLRAGASVAEPLALPLADSAEDTLLDLATIHLRELLTPRSDEDDVAVTAAGSDTTRRTRVRAAVTDREGRRRVDLVLRADVDPDGRWARLIASTGDAFEVHLDALLPVPVEIVHLRIRSWLRVLLDTHLPTAVTQVRGLFVVGCPRSGTTLMGNYLGSHPAVLGLAEYGGFYVAHSVAPTYLARLPGREQDGFAAALGGLAADNVVHAARAQGCSWYCDATPWNLEVAGRILAAQPDAVFVLALRHFSGAVLSLRQFGWAGGSIESAARLWVRMNAFVTQLPVASTLVIGYDALAADPVGTLGAIHEALAELGLDPQLLDDTQLATSHAAVTGHDPRPTLGEVVDGEVLLRPMPSLDERLWTKDVHARVWPIVADMHDALQHTFAGVYVAPPRPDHVAAEQW